MVLTFPQTSLSQLSKESLGYQPEYPWLLFGQAIQFTKQRQNVFLLKLKIHIRHWLIKNVLGFNQRWVGIRDESFFWTQKVQFFNNFSNQKKQRIQKHLANHTSIGILLKEKGQMHGKKSNKLLLASPMWSDLKDLIGNWLICCKSFTFLFAWIWKGKTPFQINNPNNPLHVKWYPLKSQIDVSCKCLCLKSDFWPLFSSQARKPEGEMACFFMG